MDKTFLIIGSGGQLAKEFALFLMKNGNKYSAPGEKELDITDPKELDLVIRQLKPDVILNCAAYNAVDKAEEDQKTAFKVNAEAVEDLALLCKKYGIFLVHFSSDYVFDGKKNNIYIETDETNPLNVYGKSKLAGEEAIIKHLDNYLVLRLSWVFGKGTQNFLHKLSQWVKQKKVLKVSSDEISVPTYTEDVVSATFLALERGLKGLYHLTSTGYCSRFELAKYYIEKMGFDCEVIPVPLASFNIRTPRPLFSAMSNQKLSKELKIIIPGWRDEVDKYISRISEKTGVEFKR